MSVWQPFEYEILIRESHLDSFGHVNNAVYLELFEEARWELVTANGYGLERVRETGLGPVILSVQVLFRRELKLRQKIRIRTQVLSHRDDVSGTQLVQEMLDHENKLYCRAEFKMAFFNLRTRKLVPSTP